MIASVSGETAWFRLSRNSRILTPELANIKRS
ncbi:MAG: hypothetical protein RL303_1476, partial [Verrucomicrobiota bacterium]